MILWFCALFTLLAVTQSNADPHVLVCYFGTWAGYRQGEGKFDPEDIDPCLCTHVIYTFMGIKDTGEVHELDPWMDDSDGKNGIKRTLDLKKKCPDIKISYAVGGWNEGSQKYSSMVRTPSKRQLFISSAVEYGVKHGFDGFDLDWEYPAKRGGVPEDKAAFTELLPELYAALHKAGMYFTMAVGAAPDLPQVAYDLPVLSKYVDYVHLMTYDLHGPWDTQTGPNSALYNDSQKLDIDSTLKLWQDAGMDLGKIVLGCATYGHCFNMAGGSTCSYGQRCYGGADGGPYTNQQGMRGYNEICQDLKNGGWDTHFDDATKTQIACKGSVLCSYDDPHSLSLKAQYAIDKKLAGVMIWSVETDDFHGKCHGEKFPLLRSLKSSLNLEICNGYEPPTTSSTTSSTGSSSSSSSTEHTTQTTTTTSSGGGGDPNALCQHSGFVRDPKNCQIFYECVPNNNGFDPIRFECASGLAFDETIKGCNYKDQVKC